MNDTRIESRRIQLALIRQRLNDGARDALIDLWEGAQLWLQLDGESPADGFARLLDLVRGFEGFPKAKQWAVRYSRQFYPVVGHGQYGQEVYAGDAEWESYLAKLEASGNDDMRQAAGEIRRERARSKAEEEAGLARQRQAYQASVAGPTTRAAPTTGPVARLLPIDLRLVFPAGRKVEPPPRVSGWVQAGRGVDVLWSAFDLFVMTEPGVARAVWSDAQRSQVAVESACFDGRYVWAAARHADGRLVVLDPEAGRTWEVTKADGLLPMSNAVAVAPLEPGKVCVVGGFQPPGVTTLGVRGWCAVVTFDPKAGASVKVFHEATRVIQDDWKEKLATADVGFSPAYLAIVGAGADRRLVVGRTIDANAYRCFAPPLIVDPEALTVKLWEGDLKLPGKRNGPWCGQIARLDGSLYFAEPAFVEGRLPPKGWKPKLFQAGGAGVTVKQIGQLPPIVYRQGDRDGEITSAVGYDGRVYLAGPDLYAIDPATGAAVALPHPYPDGSSGCNQLAVSGHFGLVTWRDVKGDPNYRQDFFRFDLPPQRE